MIAKKTRSSTNKINGAGKHLERRTKVHRSSTGGSGDETDQYEDTEWEVEKVIGKRFDSDGRVSYLLKWKYWDGEPTWEPEDNCACDKLIDDYEQRISRQSNGDTRRNSATSPPPVKTKSTPKRSRRI